MELKDGPYFKVLREGKSWNGGRQAWSLPSRTGPGHWHTLPPKEAVSVCHTGFHLTNDPAKWWKEGAQVYLAEPSGAIEFNGDDKIACESVCLIKEIEPSEVAKELGVVFLRGEPEQWMLWLGSGYGDGDGYGSGSG